MKLDQKKMPEKIYLAHLNIMHFVPSFLVLVEKLPPGNFEKPKKIKKVRKTISNVFSQ